MIILNKSVELNQLCHVERLSGVAFTAESGGHKFVITCYRNGVYEPLEAGTIAAYFLCPDGTTTINLDGENGQAGIEDGKAWVHFDDTVYEQAGLFGLVVYYGGTDSTLTAIYSCSGFIRAGKTATIVEPGTVIDLSWLEAKIGQINSAINQALAAATFVPNTLAAEYAPPYSAGDYCTHSGYLYRALEAVESDAAWNSTQWKAVRVAEDMLYIENGQTDTILSQLRGRTISSISSTDLGSTGYIVASSGASSSSQTYGVYKRCSATAVPEGAKYLVIESCSAATPTSISVAFYNASTGSFTDTYMSGEGLVLKYDVVYPGCHIVNVPSGAKRYVVSSLETIPFSGFFIDDINDALAEDEAEIEGLQRDVQTLVKSVRDGNLFDVSSADNIAGYQLDANGNVAGNGSGVFTITHYIPVIPGATYEYSGLSVISGTWSNAFFYDEDYTLVNYSGSAVGFVPARGVNTLTIPAGVYYLRFCVNSGTTCNDINVFSVRLAENDTTKGECKANALAAGTMGGNLYNASATGNLAGYYLGSNGDTPVRNTQLLTDYIPVMAGYKYAYGGVTLANTTYNKLMYFNSRKSPLTDTYQSLSTGTNVLTVPDGAYYVRFSLNNNTAGTDGLKDSERFWIYMQPEARSTVLGVSPDGSQPFTTINAAFDYAANIQEPMPISERAKNPITLLLYPGTYKEVLQCTNYGDRLDPPEYPNGRSSAYPWGLYISFVGVNKKDVIWRDDTGLYKNAPINTSNPCLIKNITFISSYEDTDNYIATYAKGLETQYASYALHIDDPRNSNIPGENDSADDWPAYETRVEDCILICYHAPALGIGMRYNQTVVLKNCELRTELPETPTTTIDGTAYRGLLDSYAGKNGVLGFHPTSNATENIPQRLVVDNCYLYTNGRYVLFPMSGVTSTCGMDIEFYRNFLWSTYETITYGEIANQHYAIKNESKVEFFSGQSFGNNVELLNSSDPALSDSDIATVAETESYLGIS